MTPTPATMNGVDLQAVPGVDHFYTALSSRIAETGQLTVLRYWNDLTPGQRDEFARQLAAVDWEFVRENGKRVRSGIEACSPLHDIQPCRHFITLKDQTNAQGEARKAGETLLRQGKVAAIVVAGGLATRLGVTEPKGVFPIGPVSGKSFFQLFAEQIVALNRRFQTSIPYLVMTSEATHDQTVEWFSKHHFFGLLSSEVTFFRQRSVPAFDQATGDLLLSRRSMLATSPDGHGGVLAALKSHGLFDRLRSLGIQTLFYHQVDNPLVRICDPVFLGYHACSQADVSTKVVRKTAPHEKVGVMACVEGRDQIVEYVDLPTDLAAARNESGQLQFWAGNTGIHAFQREFLEQVANADSLRWHSVQRKVPCVNRSGELESPAHPNAVKFERFIFDILPLATRSIAVEVSRELEFAPLKNADGDCSPADVQRAMTSIAVARLRDAGIEVTDSICVEISPLAALPDEPLHLSAHGPRIIRTPTLIDKQFLIPNDSQTNGPFA